MGDWLSAEAGMELAENNVSYDGSNNQSCDTGHKMEIPDKDEISDSAHSAESCFLSKKAYGYPYY